MPSRSMMTSVGVVLTPKSRKFCWLTGTLIQDGMGYRSW